jgi:PAS domain S-box-containing protein
MSSESQLKQILQHIGEAFVCLNRQWQFTFANNKALALANKPGEDLAGKILWEVFPHSTGSLFEAECRRAMERQEQAVFQTQFPPSSLWLEVRAYPHEEGLAVFFTDITARHEAEEHLRFSNAALGQALEERTFEFGELKKEMEAFTYSVSHDLRSPLRAIHGYMSILMEDYGEGFDEEARRLSDIILKNTDRMEQLINDLLELSRVSRKELSKHPVNMTDLVNAVWRDMEQAETHRHIRFSLSTLPGALADSRSLKQVWINLLSNALKYTRDKAIAIIEIGAYEHNGETIYYIKDNGAGFDMSYYDKLFGVFQRLHSQDQFEGTGVGLSIAQRVLQRHGGRIWAESEPGRGATFFFVLQVEP